MDTLEPNMYVRTKWGYICKLININEFREPSMKYGVEANYLKDIMFIGDDDILKASHNIIELLELGDIVEVFMEMDLDKENTNAFEVVAITIDKKEIGVFGKDLEIDFIPIENIKRILTREQFSQMAYKIGD